MNSKIKTSALIIICVLASVITSYVTAVTIASTSHNQSTSTQSNNNNQSSNTQNQTTSQTSKTIIHPQYKLFLEIGQSSYVQVSSIQIVHNLTITYQYTCLNGTVKTTTYSYGDYLPTWQGMVSVGDTPYLNYVIPDNIISACSTIVQTKTGTGTGYVEGYGWGVYPKLTLTVFGYA